MANNIAFTPMGKTVKLTANASTPNNAPVLADSPVQQYRLVNHSSQPVYVWISPGSSPVNVALPTGSGANASYSLCIPNGTVAIVTGPQCTNTANVQVSVISENDGPELYITPGEGL